MSTNIEKSTEKYDEISKQLLLFLQKCGISCDNINNLNNMVIPREILINESVYKTLKDDIKEFKKIFSSSYLTCLQNTASSKQRWLFKFSSPNITRSLL